MTTETPGPVTVPDDIPDEDTRKAKQAKARAAKAAKERADLEAAGKTPAEAPKKAKKSTKAPSKDVPATDDAPAEKMASKNENKAGKKASKKASTKDTGNDPEKDMAPAVPEAPVVEVKPLIGLSLYKKAIAECLGVEGLVFTSRGPRHVIIKSLLAAYAAFKGKRSISAETRTVIGLLKEHGSSAVFDDTPPKQPRISRDTILLILSELSVFVNLGFVSDEEAEKEKLDDAAVAALTKKRISEAPEEVLMEKITSASSFLQPEDDVSVFTKTNLNKLGIGPWYNPESDVAREEAKARRDKVLKERKRAQRIRNPTPKIRVVVYTRAHSLVDAIKKLLVDGQGATAYQLMAAANDIYRAHGGNDNQRATNVTNYTLAGLAAVGALYLEGSKRGGMWFMNPDFEWPQAPDTVDPDAHADAPADAETED